MRMKRRVFLGASAGTAWALSFTGGGVAQGQRSASVLNSDGRLGGKTLEELRDQYRYDLFTEYIPFHDKWVVDHEYGGFTLKTGWNGPTLSYEKTSTYEGRGIWTYSFLYSKVDPNPRHLEAARKSVEFIMKHKPSGDTLWPSTYSREGKAISGPPTPIYPDLFIADGLQEFSKIKGNEQYWDIAKEIMFKCIRIYDRPGYYPEIGKSELGADTPLMTGGARIQGHWFVLLWMATKMLEFRSDPEVEAVAARSVDAILNRHYNPAFGLNVEILNHDFSTAPEVIAEYVCTGHSIETLWMVLYEAVRKRDRALFDLAAERFRRHAEVAWDYVYGGVFYGLRNVDNNVWWTTKYGWVQMEALIGTLCIIEHTGAQWAKDYFARLYPWVMAKFPLKQYGYPLWIDSADRWVKFDKGDGSRRAENFHHPRQLMLNMLAVERMIKRGGKTSGIFT
jgi:mannose/cellobiose epimerase-like protein (N-acyl-D-glucosamine 2-epimerase family)